MRAREVWPAARKDLGWSGGEECLTCGRVDAFFAIGWHQGSTGHNGTRFIPPTRRAWRRGVWKLGNSVFYRLLVILFTHYSPSRGTRPPR